MSKTIRKCRISASVISAVPSWWPALERLGHVYVVLIDSSDQVRAQLLVEIECRECFRHDSVVVVYVLPTSAELVAGRQPATVLLDLIGPGILQDGSELNLDQTPIAPDDVMDGAIAGGARLFDVV